MTNNYDAALDQLRAFGLAVDHLVPDGRMHRCLVEGEGRERRGWYCVHEWRAGDGNIFVVGSYGVWHGNDNGAQKIELGKSVQMSAEDRAAIKARMALDRKRAKASRDREAAEAARQAERVWSAALVSEPSGAITDYLTRKGVQSYGLRYTTSGALVVPMQGNDGRIHGLQFILPSHHPRRKKTGRDKEYWPAGLAKQGHYHLIGNPGVRGVVLVAEGYATAATLRAATDLPVAVAFDAGNLRPGAEAIKKRYRGARVLICADDDYLTEGNPGVAAAQAAALAVEGAWVAPVFPSDRGGKKLTDYNDLQQFPEGGLLLVRSQIEDKLTSLGWDRGTARGAEPGGAGNAAAESLKPLLQVDEAVERFSLVYGSGGSMFDHQEARLAPKSDVLDICVDHAWREWKMRPDRRVVRVEEVGFDPPGTDAQIKCNLWNGWPTKPKAGNCEALLDLLRFLCSHENNDTETIYQWMLKWLAYPIQHAGAKMKTAVIMHGPQGAGKNMFFEAIMAIYGAYGRIVDQASIEDKFNDWASRKLFLIADEVVARNELYHTKNKIKGFITGDWIRINPKNVTPHDERNHVNIAFLSNESQPLVLEKDDRRFAVIWTPGKLPQNFYVDVALEIEAGGIAALHDYLVNLDLGDFKPWTLPPMTQAKADLIDLGLESTERFWQAWVTGELECIPIGPAKSEDLYELYRAWCTRVGIGKPATLHKLMGQVGKRVDAKKAIGRYLNGRSPDATQCMFVYPPKHMSAPEGMSLTKWHTEAVEKFRQGLFDWKKSGNNGDY